MMSELTRSQSVGFDPYLDHQKGFGSFDDFLISALTEPDAPQPEQFDSELDSIAAGLDSTVITSNIFTIPLVPFYNHNNTPSVFTSSSDSFDTVSTLSDSFYNYPKSPYPTFDFDMELGQVHTRAGSDYASSASLNSIDSTTDPTSFGTLPPTPPHSPGNKIYDGSYANPGYYPTGGNTVTPDSFFSPLDYGVANLNHPTVSPLNVSTGPATAVMDEQKMDPRKKHRCPKCPRAFARAFNLKTHMGTHDPNRPKPHICPHRNCGRSFSRKHDLGRHLTSIHRDEAHPPKRAIGVAKSGRAWCDNCGKGFVGRSTTCNCLDIK